jgi:hypothetical protein
MKYIGKFGQFISLNSTNFFANVKSAGDLFWQTGSFMRTIAESPSTTNIL